LFKTPALVQLLTTKPKYTKVLTDLFTRSPVIDNSELVGFVTVIWDSTSSYGD